VVRLRNRTARQGALRLVYLPSRGVPRAAIAAPRRIARGDYAVVRLRLTLPAGQPPDRLDGLLVARMPGSTARLRVRGTGPRVTFDPRKLELSVDRYGPLATGGIAEVVVRGPDAPALAAAHTPIGAQILTDGDAAIRVAVGAPRAEDGVFVAPVTVQDAEGLDTGSFTGTVPVSGSTGSDNGLRVEVKVGFSFLVMALVVLLGSILGGFAQRYSEVGRDARILRLRLKAAVADYDAKLATCPGKRPASYALDTWLDPRPQHQGFARYPGTRGVAGMQWHLGTARTKRDVDEQRFRVRAVVRHVERWLTLEPVARAAAGVLDERPPRRGNVSMLQCAAFKDVRRLLDDARAAPDPALHAAFTDEETYLAHERREDQASARLAQAVAEQTVVLDLALQAWCYLAGSTVSATAGSSTRRPTPRS
ncbi:MAG TPA: hypothetical protein VN238_21085, partial [Solirubrobacteraceae bacterium]|nr:hypothetical protein [Solirubrobacteraceae bacterium]